MPHEHNFDTVVRMRGKKVRKQCECRKIGPWVAYVSQAEPIKPKPTQVDLDHVYSQLTVAHLRDIAKSNGVTGYSKMTKATLIDALKP